MKPAIGILIRALDLGGAEKQSLLQAYALASDFQVYYFIQKKYPRLDQHVEYISKKNIHCIQLSGNILQRAFQLIKHSRKHNIRLIYAYLTLDNLLAAIASLFTRITFIGGVRNCYLPPLKYALTKFMHKFFFDYMIFNNYRGKELFVKKGFSPDKLLVLHNCIEEFSVPVIREKNVPVKIISVGRFDEQKDYYTALQVIKHLHSKSVPASEIEYSIIGDGRLESQIRKWISELHLENVNLVISPDNLRRYYIESDIYLMTSLYEGIPNTIMEALNYSLPIVSTNVGDINYLVKDGINGYLSKPKDIEGLAESLQKLVSSHTLRNDFGKKGYDILKRDFSFESFKEEYISLTRKLLEKSNIN
jgi:glycosyltransferase involved in cell wall biosynthesis